MIQKVNVRVILFVLTMFLNSSLGLSQPMPDIDFDPARGPIDSESEYLPETIEPEEPRVDPDNNNKENPRANCYNLPNGVRSYWPFDEEEEFGMSVEDLFWINHGTWQDLGTLNTIGPVEGVLNNGLRLLGNFDTGIDHILVPHDQSLNFGKNQDFTFEAWVKINGQNPHARGILSKMDALNQIGVVGYSFLIHENSEEQLLELRMASYNPELDYQEGYESFYSELFPTIRESGEWHQIAVSVDRNANGRFFLDGTTIGVFDPTHHSGLTMNNQQDLKIGKNWILPYGLDSYIDEVVIYDRALFPSEIQANYNAMMAEQHRCPAPEPSTPLAWWPFDEGEISEPVYGIVEDIHGDHNGLAVNAPIAAHGKVNNSLQFDGEDDYVLVEHEDTLNFSNGNFSVTAWVKIQEGVSGTLISKFDIDNQQGWLLQVDQNGVLMVTVEDTGYAYSNSEYSLDDNLWHHIVATVNTEDSEIKLYRDGVLYSTISDIINNPIVNTTHPISIGAIIRLNHQSEEIEIYNPLNGRIDELSLFDRLLTPEEITGIYENGLIPTPKPDEGGCNCNFSRSAPSTLQSYLYLLLFAVIFSSFLKIRASLRKAEQL